MNPTPDIASFHVWIEALVQNTEHVIKGKREQILQVLACLFARGHILVEDNPGTGKTVMAKTLAASVSGTEEGHAVFKRVQFTPDLLPMDLLGTHIFDDVKKEFIFRKGPLFCNVLLADEINRASPKVQSALLECMAENQITMGERTYALEDFFFTIATQNPVEMEGTYPLPAAQLDRFAMKIRFGYTDEETESAIFRNYHQIQSAIATVQPVLTIHQILQIQEAVHTVFVHDEIIQSVLHLIRTTRQHEGIRLGASTRCGISFIHCLRAYALVQGRSFVIEDDFLQLAYPILHHRLIYKNREAQQDLLPQLIQKEMKRLYALKLMH